MATGMRVTRQPARPEGAARKTRRHVYARAARRPGCGVTRVARDARSLFTIVLLLARAAQADLTASYDGSFAIPAAGESALVASGLMQAGSSLTGTIAVHAATPGVTGLYYVTGTL